MIPLFRPKLPPLSQLIPYLEAIDETRSYSNYGPHALAFEERLRSNFQLESGTVTTVANATLGLALALLAQKPSPGTLCALPAWTFTASVNAVILAGLEPYFLDIDRSTWALDPAAVEQEIARAPTRIGSVMVVAPFGQPIDYAAWDNFKARTSLPVVIDAAAAFDTLQVIGCPAVVSLHATKVIGVGEGGFVASKDTSIIRAIRMRTNFGFDHNRTALVPGMNAKLSEYHAAVGLASLDIWKQSRSAWLSVAGAYREAFAKSNRINLQPGFGRDWISSTCIVSVDERVRSDVQRELAAVGVETRLWWGEGAHKQPIFSAVRRTDLQATDAVARSTIGVPFYQELSKDQVQHVAHTIISVAS